MEVVIIEDERLTAERLKLLIESSEDDINVAAMLPSVKKSVEWFRDNSPPDLLFLDIQLHDGTGFDVLQSLSYNVPVVFTTAFDQHAIKAFKFNSVDYLLKPINKSEVAQALKKFRELIWKNNGVVARKVDYGHLDRLISGEFKKRFLVKVGDQFRHIGVEDISYFNYHGGATYLVNQQGQKLPMDHSLENLEDLVNPLEFFRINRKLLISVKAITGIHSYFNSRLLLKLNPEYADEVIVARERVSDFKKWIDS